MHIPKYTQKYIYNSHSKPFAPEGVVSWNRKLDLARRSESPDGHKIDGLVTNVVSRYVTVLIAQIGRAHV